MKVKWPKPGRYVVAVSGGVDSVVLLYLLYEQGKYDLVVAHLDHGIRKDSVEDRILVQELAKKLKLEFAYKEAKLGTETSEANAREVRYKFLREVKNKKGAAAIITAHHQDDVMETAIINILRGTGRKGLSALGDKEDIVRPLLSVTKAELTNYAHQRKLKWHEDSTNVDDNYLRNYVRQHLLTRFSPTEKAQLLELINNLKYTNQELDTLLVKYLPINRDNELSRTEFNKLSHGVAKEMLATWLRLNGIRNFDSKTLERLSVDLKTAQPGKTFPVMSGYNVKVSSDKLALLR